MQRGRGAAFVWARTHRVEARDFLVECVTKNPFWDQQLEDRAHLYGEMAELVRLESAPLAAFLDSLEEEPEFGMPGENVTAAPFSAFCIIRQLAYHGDALARALLVRQLGLGPLWNDALEQIEACEPLWDEGGAVLASRSDDEHFSAQLAEVLDTASLGTEPWLSWRARHPRLERVASTVLERPSPRRPREQVSSLSTAELLNGAPVSDPVCGWPNGGRPLIASCFALQQQMKRCRPRLWRSKLLGRQNDSAALDTAVEVLQRERPAQVRGAAIRYLRHLDPKLTLPLARQWFMSERQVLRTAAQSVLEQHATVEDVPLLCSEFPPARDSGDIRRLCAILDSLLRLPDHAPHDAVERAFVDVPYSLARARAARLLAAADSTAFADRYAYECLWDCEQETRELAAEHADRDVPGTSQRIAYIDAARHAEEEEFGRAPS